MALKKKVELQFGRAVEKWRRKTHVFHWP